MPDGRGGAAARTLELSGPQPAAIPARPGRAEESRGQTQVTAGSLPPTRPRDGGRKIPLDRLLVVGELALILVVWEFLVGVLKLVNPVFMPPPSAIGRALDRLTTSGALQEAATASLTSFAWGYGSACLVGIVLGLMVGGSRPMGKLVAPLIWALYAMPMIAIRPMTTVWFGFGSGPIIFLVFLSALLPITLNTMAGVRTVDRSLLRAAQVFGASRVQTYRKVVLPATVPFILAGLRLAVVSGWIILLISELVGAPRGFGQLLAVATSRFRVDEAFAIIVVLVLISVTSVRIIGLLESRVAAWRPGTRS